MPRHITPLALSVYAPLALIAVLWAYWARDVLPFVHPHPWMEASLASRSATSLLLGMLLAVTVIASTRVLVHKTQWARRLHLEFRNLLGSQTSKDILWLALASGFAEEMFFRGAMQPSWGLLVSAFVFGGVHVGPTRTYWPWTLWAIVMGLLLGLIFELTGVLWGTVLAHVVINHENMRFIRDYDPESGQEIEVPSFATTELRRASTSSTQKQI